jgi:hypothetical protein
MYDQAVPHKWISLLSLNSPPHRDLAFTMFAIGESARDRSVASMSFFQEISTWDSIEGKGA